MRFSPARDIIITLAILVTIFMLPFFAASFVLRPSVVPLPEDRKIETAAGNLPDMMFVTFLGMGSPYIVLVGAQPSEILGTFSALSPDWLYFSIAVFVAGGLVTAILSRTNIERGMNALIAGVLAAAIAAILVYYYVGLPSVNLSETARTQLANAAMVTTAISYVSGSIIASITGVLLGRFIFRPREEQVPVSQVIPVIPGRGIEPPKREPMVEQKPVEKIAEQELGALEKAEEVKIGEEPAKEVIHEEIVPQVITKQVEEQGPIQEAPREETVVPVVEKVEIPEEREETPEVSVPIFGIEEALAAPSEVSPILTQGEGIVAAPEQPPTPEKPAEEFFPMPLEVQAVGEQAEAEEMIGVKERAEEESDWMKTLDLIAKMEDPLIAWSKKKPTGKGLLESPVSCPICGSRLAWSEELRRYSCQFCNTVP